MASTASRDAGGASWSDYERVDAAYDRMNHLWPLHGAAAVGAVYQTPHPRAAVLGVDHGEVDRVLSRIKTFFAWGTANDWIQEWTVEGDEYAERAQAAMDAGHRRTAGEMWRLASVFYFFASYIHFHLVPVPARERAEGLAIEAYRTAAPLLTPMARRFDIPFKGHAIPGYVRRPIGASAEPSPCVLIVGGTNSTKEENHAVTRHFLERGIATCVFDGPGQNEYLRSGGGPLRMKDFDQALTAVVDWLQDDETVDGERLALFGRSSGGMTSLHGASAEPRIRAVVAHPGSYKWTYWNQRVDVYPVPLEVGHYLGARSLAETAALVEQEMTLEGVLEFIKSPVLLVTGRFDPAFPATEAELLRDQISGPVDIAYFERRVHGGPPSMSWPLAADWIADQLGCTDV